LFSSPLDIGNLLVNCRQMHQYLRCNTLVIEYRGYGNSQGSPSEHGLRLDALAGLEFAEKLGREGRIAADRLFVFGRSLGGAVAIWLAAQRPDAFAGLIVENTFASIEDMAVVLLKRFASPGAFERPLRAFLHLFMTSHWRSIDLAPTLQVPALFICGLADELVPPAHMKALFEATPGRAGSEKVFHGVPGGEHNTTFFEGGQPYYDAYAKFILRHNRKQRAEE
jgi:pimeloyl-ACP methyl ester carboxylesterase